MTTDKTTEDLDTRAGIAAAIKVTPSRQPTDAEWEGLDGLDRGDFFSFGYEAALRELHARLVKS